MADAPVAYVTVQPDALFDGLRRNIFHLRGYAPQAARGVVPRTPLFPQFAISNPLHLSRMALRLAPADLLTGLSIRTVHRTVLISGPRQHRVGGIVVSSSRRPTAVMPVPALIHISRIKSCLGLNSYRISPSRMRTMPSDSTNAGPSFIPPFSSNSRTTA